MSRDVIVELLLLEQLTGMTGIWCYDVDMVTDVDLFFSKLTFSSHYGNSAPVECLELCSIDCICVYFLLFTASSYSLLYLIIM